MRLFQRFLIVFVLAFAVFGMRRLIYAPARVLVIGPVAPRDTASHVDLRVAASASLRAVALTSRGDTVREPVRWSSGNPSVATVGTTSGVVTGKARGYATISATIAGTTGTMRVCVTPTDREPLAWSIASRRVTTTSARLRIGETSQATAHIALKIAGATSWGACVHWSLDSASSAFASIDRAGEIHTARSVGAVVATVGPSLP